MTARAIRHGLADSLQILIHLERRRGRRVVTELRRVHRYLPETDEYDLEPLERPEPPAAATSADPTPASDPPPTIEPSPARESAPAT